MDPIQAMASVDAFYSSAFDKLFTLALSALGFFGVLLPIALGLYQRRVVNLEKREVLEATRAEVEKLRIDLAQNLNAQVAEIKELLEARVTTEVEELQSSLEETIAGVFHVQALTALRNKHYAAAAVSAFNACCHNVKCKSEAMLIVVLGIAKDAADELTKKRIENSPDFERDYESARKAVETLNENGRYTAVLRDLDKAIVAARKRDEPQPEAKTEARPV